MKRIMFQAGQDAKELVHLSINFKKRTTTYDVESIDSKVIDLNEYEEDQELLDLTFYDRKAVAYWSQEIISDKGLMFIDQWVTRFSLSNTSIFAIIT